MWSLGANTHIMRAIAVNKTWSTKCDQQISQAIADLVGTNLNEIQQAICYIKMKDGGLGLGSATRRHEAAWNGAWEGGMYNLIDLLGIQSIDELKSIWPAWSNKMDEVSKQLKIKKGADPSRPDVQNHLGRMHNFIPAIYTLKNTFQKSIVLLE